LRHYQRTKGQIADLVKLVDSFNLRQGINNSLDAKSQNALKAYQAATVKNRATSCNNMASFISKVQAQAGKAITTIQSQQLMTAARHRFAPR